MIAAFEIARFVSAVGLFTALPLLIFGPSWAPDGSSFPQVGQAVM